MPAVATKIKIASIMLLWSEYDDRENVTFHSWAAAEAFVAKVRADEVAGPGIGYCKTKWTITWADGRQWTTRLDVDADTIGLGAEVRHEWEVYSGLRRITWMTKEQYADFLRTRIHPELANDLVKYELSDNPTA